MLSLTNTAKEFLHIAAKSGKLDVVKYILKTQRCLNMQSLLSTMTSLHRNCYKGEIHTRILM
ncbi:uncharacterized protein DS421_7g205020 [Arachis hypogaea]|nr:uncharacterized protein DS421_7g205020 [Arachis hypogaea]